MEDTSVLIWGMIFGAIGLGYFIYGKKQSAVVPLITGILLFVFPYFVTNVYIMVIVGVIISAMPYFIRF